MSFWKSAAATTTKAINEYEGNVFFIFDHTVLKKEEDDLKDAIIYYFPNVDPDSQCALVGQIIGMSEFFHNTLPRSRPKIMKMYHNKFILRKKGDFTFGLGGKNTLPDAFLGKQMDFLLETFVMYQGSMEALKENLQPEFLSGLKIVWDIYLPFCENVGDAVGQMFQMLPTVNIPRSSSQLFLHASHILQRCILHNNVISGVILYRNQCLCSQLPPNITKRLLILKPKQTHIARASIQTNFELPQGIQLLKVYLKQHEYEKICPRKRNNSSGKKKKSDLSEITQKAVDIEGISFIECQEVKNQELINQTNNFSKTCDKESHENVLTKISLTDHISGIKEKIENESDFNKESDAFLTASDQDEQTESELAASFKASEPTAFQKDSDHLSNTITETLEKDKKSKNNSILDSSVTTSEHSQLEEQSPYQSLDQSASSPTCGSLPSLDSVDSDGKTSSSKGLESIKFLNSEVSHFKSEQNEIAAQSPTDNQNNQTSTPNPSPSKKDVTMDTTSSDDLSMGESCVDPREIKRHAKHLLHLEQKMEKIKQKDTAISNVENMNSEDQPKDSCKSNFETKDIDSKNQDSQDVNNSKNSTPSGDDTEKDKCDLDSGLGHSSEVQGHPTVVGSTAVPVTLDVITDEDESKLIKSSGSSITSDSYSPNTDLGGSANDSLASLESMSISPPPTRKKSVTFSKIQSPEKDSSQLSSSNENNVREKKWDPSSDDLFEVVLYAQGHSDMMMLLFLETGTKCDRLFITNLWKSCVSQLADLDYEVKECLLRDKREKQNKTSDNFQYLKYDTLMQTMSGNTLEPTTSVSYDFLNTACKIHDSFSSSKTTTEQILRSHTAACYGCQSVHNETFFQLNSPVRDLGGCPSPKDTVFTLDAIATNKLESKYKQTLL